MYIQNQLKILLLFFRLFVWWIYSANCLPYPSLVQKSAKIVCRKRAVCGPSQDIWMPKTWNTWEFVGKTNRTQLSIWPCCPAVRSTSGSALWSSGDVGMVQALHDVQLHKFTSQVCSHKTGLWSRKSADVQWCESDNSDTLWHCLYWSLSIWHDKKQDKYKKRLHWIDKQVLNMCL